VEKVVRGYELVEFVYEHEEPEEVEEGKEGKELKMPRTVFLPDRAICRVMIKANILYSKTDTLDQFLIRFNLLERPLDHLKEEKESL